MLSRLFLLVEEIKTCMFQHFDLKSCEEPRSKLRGILSDVKHPQETSQNGGCRPQNPVAPFGRLVEIEPNGSISFEQA
jgi:hypothetical protein